jgi:Cu/Ag efflux protein CusF
MKRTKVLLFVAAGMLGVWGTAGAQQPSSAQPSRAKMGELMTGSAKVEKVDVDKRELTLKTKEGKPFTVDVPEGVTRLENVKPGDTVTVAFYQSLAVSLAKPGETPVGTTKETTVEKGPGTLPSGAAVEQVTTTAKVTKVDRSKNELTIETPSGEANTIKVREPEMQSRMKELKAGDTIQATYTRAVAASVTSPKSK